MIRTKRLLLVLFVLALLFATALAEETADADAADEQTEKEIRVMARPTGAVVRMLQLERAVERRLSHMDTVKNYIQENYPDADADSLEVVLAEGEEVLRTIQSETESVKDEIRESDVNATALAHRYVELKNDARIVVQNFRDATADLNVLTAADKRAIRAQLSQNEDLRPGIGSLKKRIRDLAHAHNASRVRNLLGEAAADNPELVEQVAQGEIAAKRLKDELAQRVRAFEEEKKEALRARAKRELDEAEAFGRETSKRVVRDFNERQVARIRALRERVAQSDAVPEEIRERVEERIERTADILARTRTRVYQGISQVPRNVVIPRPRAPGTTPVRDVPTGASGDGNGRSTPGYNPDTDTVDRNLDTGTGTDDYNTDSGSRGDENTTSSAVQGGDA